MVYGAPVEKFLAGFATASLLWGGAAALYVFGDFAPAEAPPVPVEVVAADTAPDAGLPAGGTRRRRGGRRGGAEGEHAAPAAAGGDEEILTGDELAEPGTRTLDVGASGGEAQLTGAQIERAFEGAMPRIRRCLLLVAGDSPVTGRLSLGLQIAGTGRVSAVNLSGPRAVVGGESGECLRAAARGVTFPSFDGPTLTASYPITLE